MAHQESPSSLVTSSASWFCFTHTARARTHTQTQTHNTNTHTQNSQFVTPSPTNSVTQHSLFTHSPHSLTHSALTRAHSHRDPVPFPPPPQPPDTRAHYQRTCHLSASPAHLPSISMRACAMRADIARERVSLQRVQRVSLDIELLSNSPESFSPESFSPQSFSRHRRASARIMRACITRARMLRAPHAAARRMGDARALASTHAPDPCAMGRPAVTDGLRPGMQQHARHSITQRFTLAARMAPGI